MAYKILVVDDSIFFRRRVKEILELDPSLEVIGEARNGQEAIDMVASLNPDVVTMDVEMPVMDGITAVKKIMARKPVPIIMFSSLTLEGAKATLDALDAGAMDFLPKKFEDIAANRADAVALLQSRVKSLCRKHHGFRPAAPRVAAPKAILFSKPVSRNALNRKGSEQATRSIVGGAVSTPLYHSSSSEIPSGKKYRCLALGTSTGGPVALQKVLTRIPKHFPHPIFIVQHMPGSFTKAFAERLNQLSKLTVKEAINGEAVQAGVAYLAPGGRQMTLQGDADRATFRIFDAPDSADILYKPSVDITFESIANVYRGDVLGVILTGMGTDGKIGASTLKRNGAKIWAQDELSSVVYGMPQAVMNAGIAEKEFSIDSFESHILKEMA
ncbi:Chemotaxis response regulator protein-glutamate methylesterase of group 1 operon [Paraglaciecola mesophila]|uniref:Protein-glutamate methylesterase/protein-glutamine glutaminase n=1 Tax=Paraglaciecola mesophila TaxID=197222 RepID=A0A857JQD0_9ALTE|nr:chemotaxis response regulator protein-glutamate methylesterase [Paraglaciecola mesophila]QHJ13618.1 Chemotaxis response regulator protein-glutamate methylesterase of group 1 operon [Paraglaciecola mesophila]